MDEEGAEELAGGTLGLFTGSRALAVAQCDGKRLREEGLRSELNHYQSGTVRSIARLRH